MKIGYIILTAGILVLGSGLAMVAATPEAPHHVAKEAWKDCADSRACRRITGLSENDAERDWQLQVKGAID